MVIIVTKVFLSLLEKPKYLHDCHGNQSVFTTAKVTKADILHTHNSGLWELFFFSHGLFLSITGQLFRTRRMNIYFVHFTMDCCMHTCWVTVPKTHVVIWTWYFAYFSLNKIKIFHENRCFNEGYLCVNFFTLVRGLILNLKVSLSVCLCKIAQATPSIPFPSLNWK